MKKVTYYQIYDLNHLMYHADKFDTLDEAKKVLKEQYTNRNKGDGHDEYWRNRTSGIQKITVITEPICNNKNN